MTQPIQTYNNSLAPLAAELCNTLAPIICNSLPVAEYKIWHGHPVWFLAGNPFVGYSKRKAGIVLLFWSGQSFDEEILENEGSFKAAQMVFNKLEEINEDDLKRLLEKSKLIQWDYKNIVKRKCVLEKLTEF